MAYSKVGLYTISRRNIQYFDSNRTSDYNFFYWIETVASESGAWDYVPCAREDSVYWAMLVSKSVDENGYISVIEFDYTSTYNYTKVHNYSFVPESKRSLILSASSRNDLTNLGLVRESTTGIHPDLAYISGSSSGVMYTFITRSLSGYVAYIGPDVVFVGEESYLTTSGVNRYITNYFVLNRPTLSGNLLSTSGLFALPYYGYGTTTTSSRYLYAFSPILAVNCGLSIPISSNSGIYSIGYNIYPPSEDIIYLMYQPKILVYNNPYTHIYNLDFGLVAHTNSPASEIVYNEKTYKYAFVSHMYSYSSFGNMKVYLLIEKEVS